MTVAHILFPGINDAESVQISAGRDIQPGTATVIAPLKRLNNPSSGTLVIRYHDQNAVVWQNCVVTSHTLTVSNGHLVEIRISDWRWRWSYGEISGWYNRRKPDSEELIPAWERTPKELAELLLTAMGEVSFEISALDGLTARPEVKWHAVNPAQELSKLCRDLGRVIVPNYALQRVEIHKVGVGVDLPLRPLSIISPSLSVGNIDVPSSVKVFSAPVQVDTRWLLEAVGEEADGTLKPLNQLSYFPQQGYFDEQMLAVLAAGTDKEYKLALRSVYKYYRIVSAVQWPAAAGPAPVLDDVEFETERLLLHTTLDRRMPAAAFGEYFDNEGKKLTNTKGEWEDSVRLEEKRRIVIFNRACFKYDANMLPTAATMYLETSCRVRNGTTGGYTRQKAMANVPNSTVPTLPQSVLREDIRWTLRYTWTDLTAVGALLDDTQRTVDDLQAIADERAAAISPLAGQQAVYNGIHNDKLDGFRDRISWSFGINQAPKTTLVARSELNPYFPSEEDRKKNNALNRILERAEAEELREEGVI